MSNYTVQANWSEKDGLTTGNPLKVVSSVELETEFSAISTSVNSKADTASPTFTGTVTIPTLTLTGALNGTVDGGTY
jgi:hypothetical protein